MSAQTFESPNHQESDAVRPDFFDVNEVLTRALELSDTEAIDAIEAYNIRFMKPFENKRVEGKGMLVINFKIINAALENSYTKTLEIDDGHRPLPESLIAEFGSLALKSPYIERFDFTGK